MNPDMADGCKGIKQLERILARPTDLLTNNLHEAWTNLVRAYNCAKNNRQTDIANKIAYAIADALVCLEHARAMSSVKTYGGSGESS